MRTTLTLDPDVARMIEEEAHRTRTSFKQVVNQAIRRGLAPRGSRRSPKPYVVTPHVTRLLPGLDRGRLNALADDLEDLAVLAKARRAAERRR